MGSKLRDALIIIAVSGITTLNIFLNGALTVGLPTIGRDLHFRQADLQWPVNVFSLSYGCMLLLFGRIGDIVGGRTMFLLGSAWFAVWSLAAAFAPNPVAFIVFVAMKGLGAAANTPAGIGLFVAHFPPGPRRNKAFGILGAGQPIGFILGLVLGGVIVQSRATWRGIFYVQTALGFLFVLLGWFVIGKDQESRKYTKGLDLGGAFLSTAGVGLLTFSLADATAAPRGWSTPYVIGCTIAAVVLLVMFWMYEQYREKHDLSVLMPPSMWRQPGSKMIAVISMVFFGWWSFNTLIYFATLYYQQVLLLSPLQTSIRFIAMVIAAVFTNLLGGWLMNRVPGQILMVGGLLGNVAAPIIFALVDVNGKYWEMMFFVMILVVGADVLYPVGTLQISSAFDDKSQSLAGGIFNVATRLGTALGVGVTSSIATAVSENYNRSRPDLAADSPEVLMRGFRAAGWTLFACGVIGVLIGIVGLRGIGIVGRKKAEDERTIAETAEERKSVAGSEKDADGGERDVERGEGTAVQSATVTGVAGVGVNVGEVIVADHPVTVPVSAATTAPATASAERQIS